VEAQTAWIARQGRRGDLERLQVQIRERLRAIARHPEIGRDREHSGIRELTLYPLPFVIWYRLEESGSQVRIVHLFHHRQDRILE